MDAALDEFRIPRSASHQEPPVLPYLFSDDDFLLDIRLSLDLIIPASTDGAVDPSCCTRLTNTNSKVRIELNPILFLLLLLLLLSAPVLEHETTTGSSYHHWVQRLSWRLDGFWHDFRSGSRVPGINARVVLEWNSTDCPEGRINSVFPHGRRHGSHFRFLSSNHETKTRTKNQEWQ